MNQQPPANPAWEKARKALEKVKGETSSTTPTKPTPQSEINGQNESAHMYYQALYFQQ